MQAEAINSGSLGEFAVEGKVPIVFVTENRDVPERALYSQLVRPARLRHQFEQAQAIKADP